MILIGVGVDNFNDWGVMLASTWAPFSLLGVSPALVMVIAGVVGVQLFIAWTERQAGP